MDISDKIPDLNMSFENDINWGKILVIIGVLLMILWPIAAVTEL